MNLKQLAICSALGGPYKDDLFNVDSAHNRDDCHRNYRILRDELRKMHWECHTSDYFQNKQVKPDACLFVNIPKKPIGPLIHSLFNSSKEIPLFAILSESEIIWQKNSDLCAHQPFTAIFTRDQTLTDNQRYFPINVPNQLTFEKGNIPFHQKKLCTMIAGNHINKHPFELYSKRIEFIRWFDQNHPNDFDLYGKGWDRKIFYQPRILRALNRIPAITQLLAHRYSCYRGPIERKRDILHQYKYSICFENAHSFPNYITEKIFDSFNAGCVPIYWGAPNITDRVPKDCFIDFREFKDYAKVYDRISMITESDHNAYLKNIEDFLSSQKAHEFSHEHYAKTIAETISSLYSRQ